jgi:hypothetical protein
MIIKILLSNDAENPGVQQISKCDGSCFLYNFKDGRVKLLSMLARWPFHYSFNSNSRRQIRA